MYRDETRTTDFDYIENDWKGRWLQVHNAISETISKVTSKTVFGTRERLLPGPWTLLDFPLLASC